MNLLAIDQLTQGSLVQKPRVQKPGTSQIDQLNPSYRDSALSVANYTTNGVWHAFQDGMRALHQYAGGFGIDSSLIAKANLRLLHRTLLDDPSYREKIDVAEHSFVKKGLPTIANLLTTNGLSADLITLQPGCGTLIKSCKQSNRMIMVVSGKAFINNTTDSSNNMNSPPLNEHAQHNSWWKIILNTSNKNIFKQEDIILFDQNDHKGKSISTLEHHCVLLNVSLPVSQTVIAH